jgi:hypothetical protein
MSTDKARTIHEQSEDERISSMTCDAIEQASIFRKNASSEIYADYSDLPEILVAVHMVTAAISFHAAEVREAAHSIAIELETLRLTIGEFDRG